MPHLRIEYSKNLEDKLDIQALCDELLQACLAQVDHEGKRVFPIGGARVLAYPASHYAIADGGSERGFIYVNIRVIAGRSPAIIRQVGDNLSVVLNNFLEPYFATETIGYTLQIDEGADVYDNKGGNLRTIQFTES